MDNQEQLEIIREQVIDTCIGRVRRCSSLQPMEIAFLVISLLSTLVAIGITIERIVTVNKSSPDFTFAIVLLINCLFCLYYILSGVFGERPYELAILVVATLILLIYLVINYAVGKKGPAKLVRLIIASILSPLFIVLSYFLIKSYYQSKSLIFRTVGAKAALQDMCNTLFVFIGLLTGDLQVNVNMSILILTSGDRLDLEDKVLLPIMLCVSVASAVLGYFSARLEKKRLAKSYAALWILIPAYAIFLIVKSVVGFVHHESSSKVAIHIVTVIAAVVSIIVRFLLLYYGIKVYRNFNKRLREKVYRGQASATLRASAEGNEYQCSDQTKGKLYDEI